MIRVKIELGYSGMPRFVVKDAKDDGKQLFIVEMQERRGDGQWHASCEVGRFPGFLDASKAACAAATRFLERLR